MIHLATVAGGVVRHQVPLGTAVAAGDVVAYVEPAGGPREAITAPMAGIVEQQRLEGEAAPPFSHLVGLTRAVLAPAAGRLTWIATLGPVGPTTLVALLDTGQAVHPLRAGGAGFVGRPFARLGALVARGAPLLELRGDEL
ncbi:MAG: hypothetical protein KC613_21655 [Myxococcales bacterium]|nr:hypothetical protein [Myxococcales bacterium]MCB9521972.1 hypothetical protein [Myxococcales bacterium]